MKLDMLAFAAHPDDIELTCGGTIIKLVCKGYQIGIIDLTQGELGTRGNAEIRQKEASTAADIMGVKIRENLGIPDGNIEINMKNRLHIIKIIRRYKPCLIFLPYWKGRHFDHIHCSHLVSEAAFYAGLSKIETEQRAYRPLRLIYYMIRHDFRPTFIVDISDYFEDKLKAIRAHESQFTTSVAPGEPFTAMNSPEFLRGIETRARYYGSFIGVDYGEPFYMKEILKLDDPIEFCRNTDPGRIVNTLGE
jgi:bacillithiol biosynthesis deacetylase BshB1